ncbi:MAG: hypothetical protein ACK4Y5_17185 [Acetobacteraceae bacterium]
MQKLAIGGAKSGGGVAHPAIVLPLAGNPVFRIGFREVSAGLFKLGYSPAST